MKTKKFNYTLLVGLSALALYLMVPACGGNKSDSNPNSGIAAVPPAGSGVNCGIPGQICQNPIPGAAGIPLVTTLSTLDYQGSIIQLTFAAPQVTANQQYNGQVNVSGLITLAPGACMYLPPGQYPISGTGSWQSGVGMVASVGAQMQLASGGAQGGPIQIYAAAIYGGRDPMNPQSPGGYYLQGKVAVPACGRTFTAL